MALPSTPATDPTEACIAYFSSLLELSDPAIGFLRNRLAVQRFSKGTLLMPVGRVNAEIYFIHAGLLRNYSLNTDGKDITNWFALESNIIFDPHSYRNQIPNQDNTELLESSVLVSLKYEDLRDLYQLDPPARSLGQRITEMQLLYMANRVNLFRSFNSEQRYLQFLELFPEMSGRVQHQHVASFLNISRETVSRILSSKIKKK